MKPTILLQLDTDPQPSAFDAVVAIDAGVEHLLRHAGVNPANVRDIVHGALFTRGVGDLHRTAIFIGGSDVRAGEVLLAAVRDTFFGPFRVSTLIDSNGSNTTAAAAVMAALEACGGNVRDIPIALLGGTGPVGQRIARLLRGEGAVVRIASRQIHKANQAAEAVALSSGHRVQGIDMSNLPVALADTALVIGAGAAGVQLLPAELRKELPALKALIDLNAVPPLGLEGVEPNDKAVDRDGVVCWGALGIGGTKMKIHRRAIEHLFSANDLVLDAEEVFALGRGLPPKRG